MRDGRRRLRKTARMEKKTIRGLAAPGPAKQKPVNSEELTGLFGAGFNGRYCWPLALVGAAAGAAATGVLSSGRMT
jgi:hypothetical protein